MQRQQYQHYNKRGHGPGSHRGGGYSSHRELHRSGSGAGAGSVAPAPQHPAYNNAGQHDEPEPAAPISNYDQVLRFLQDGWNRSKEDGRNNLLDDSCATVNYKATESNPLKDFVPVNLEEFARNQLRRRKSLSGPHSTS